MLVLGRKVNQSIVVGEDIVITVLAVDADRVKIGIEAPRHTTILRQELYDSIRQENLLAASSAVSASKRLFPSVRDDEQKDQS